MGILIFIIFSGASTYISIPKESTPDVSIPIVYISLSQNGISAQDSERLLVKPIEDEVKTVEGVREVRSTAYSGGGNVLLEFDAGFDSDQAMVDIRDKVDRAKGDLPSEADEPTVNEVNISTFPILSISLSGDVPNRTLQDLADILQDDIETIPSVLEAKIGGKRTEQVDILINPTAVESYGINLESLINIVREIIQVKSVKADLIEKNIGYIRLTSFNENSSEQIRERIIKMKKNENLKGYILDLRNNPGGLLSQAIKISDFFLENGEIVSTKSRQIKENRKWFAKKGDITNGKTLVVLINYGSASASEIVAGALKDHKRAIIIRENSYGKGSVQSIIPLKNKGAIRLTIAKYYLPSGKSISEVGVTPDIEIAESSEDFKFNSDTDNQLNFALKLLNG